MSTLFVDTLEPNQNTAITAAAGKLLPAGHVVDYQYRNFGVNSILNTTSGSMVNCANIYVDITPKSSTNLLVFKTEMIANIGTIGNYCRFDIYDTNAAARWNTGSYAQSSNYYAGTSEYETISIAHTNVAGTTNAMRLQLRALVTSGATLNLNWSGADERTIEVWEIAQ